MACASESASGKKSKEQENKRALIKLAAKLHRRTRMHLFVPMRLLLLCLASMTLTSCGSTPKPSPQSFSVQIKEASDDQTRAICAEWKDEPLPASIQARVDAAGAAQKAFDAKTGPAPTADQTALLDWFNRDIGRVTKRQIICGG